MTDTTARGPDLRRHDRRHAARVALGLLVPGLLLLAAGHPELMLYAAFGSFAGMYGRRDAPRERLRHQLHGAGMLVTGSALGITLADHRASAVVLVCCVTAFATAGSVLTDWLRVHPGGPFFGIFALGATATVSPDLVDPWAALAICGSAAMWTILLGLVVPLLLGELPLRSAQPAEEQRDALPPGSRTHALRYAVATGAAGLAGLGFGFDHANWAMTAAAVPLAVVRGGEPLDLGAVLHRGLERVGGTGLGLVLSAAVLAPEPGATVLALAVIGLLFPTELFMSRHYGVALGFFTPLIMIMTELAEPSDPVTMLLSRGVDTLLGVVAGVTAAALISGRRTPRPA